MSVTTVLRTKRDLKVVFNIAEAMFMIYEQLVGFGHLFHVIKLVCNLRITDKTLEKLDEEYEALRCKLGKMQAVLESAEVPMPKQPPIESQEVACTSNDGQAGYEASVNKEEVGAKGVLVGESLMHSTDPKELIQELQKICGLTRVEDARLASKLGCDFLGFILAEIPSGEAILKKLRK